MAGRARRLCQVAAMAFLLGAPAAARAACDRVTWTTLPTPDDMAEAYPSGAWVEGREGRAVLHCTLRPNGSLSDCNADAGTPDVYGFGPAALQVASKLKAAPCGSQGDPPFAVNIPLVFKMPPGPVARAAAFKSPGQYMPPAGPYWPDRAYREGARGVVLADCQVSPDNRLHRCKIVADTNPNRGFSDAVLRMAEVGFMTAAPLPAGAATTPDDIWRFRVDFNPTHKLGTR